MGDVAEASALYAARVLNRARGKLEGSSTDTEAGAAVVAASVRRLDVEVLRRLKQAARRSPAHRNRSLTLASTPNSAVDPVLRADE